MSNFFVFTLSGIKELLIKEISTPIITVQSWIVVALVLVVIILAVAIVSAVINSKKKPENESSCVPYGKSTMQSAPNSRKRQNAEKSTVLNKSSEKTVEKATEKEEKISKKPIEKIEEKTAEKPVKKSVEKTVVQEVKPIETVSAENKNSKEEEQVKELEVEAVYIEEEKPAEEVVATVKKSSTVYSPKISKPQKKVLPAPKESEEKPSKAKAIKNVDKVFGGESTDKVDFDALKKSNRKNAPSDPVSAPTKTAIGKFVVYNSSIGGFRYMLLANNSQILYESRDYKTYETCCDAIGKFINSVKNGNFSVRADKFGNYKYHLKSATSNNIIYIGESYTTQKSCLNSVESVKRFAAVSPIVDGTEEDFEVESNAFEIPKEVVEAVAKKQGAVGKWAIEKVEPEEENSPYCFLLYANNGQLLYESRDFSSYVNCRKGLDTFISTVKNGYFIIDRDKFNRFKFFLRSKKTGSQAEYVGPNYSDKASCYASATSVYKFALLTPINLD